MLNWVNENIYTLMWIGVVVFMVLGGGLIGMWIKDVRDAVPDREESGRLLDGYGLSDAVTETAVIPVFTGFRPRPTSHAYPDQDAVADSDDEVYIGRHRQPENVTASYLRAIMTQTQSQPILRRLDPSWRSVTPWPAGV